MAPLPPAGLDRDRGAAGPSVWPGPGGPSRTAAPSAPGAGGERGLPTLLVLPSAAPPAGPFTRTEPDFTSPASVKKNRKKTPNQVPSATRLRVRRLHTGISSTASVPPQPKERKQIHKEQWAEEEFIFLLLLCL